LPSVARVVPLKTQRAAVRPGAPSRVIPQGRTRQTRQGTLDACLCSVAHQPILTPGWGREGARILPRLGWAEASDCSWGRHGESLTGAPGRPLSRRLATPGTHHGRSPEPPGARGRVAPRRGLWDGCARGGAAGIDGPSVAGWASGGLFSPAPGAWRRRGRPAALPESGSRLPGAPHPLPPVEAESPSTFVDGATSPSWSGSQH
jgi:hypothetical protein